MVVGVIYLLSSKGPMRTSNLNTRAASGAPSQPCLFTANNAKGISDCPRNFSIRMDNGHHGDQTSLLLSVKPLKPAPDTLTSASTYTRLMY